MDLSKQFRSVLAVTVSVNLGMITSREAVQDAQDVISREDFTGELSFYLSPPLS